MLVYNKITGENNLRVLCDRTFYVHAIMVFRHISDYKIESWRMSVGVGILPERGCMGQREDVLIRFYEKNRYFAALLNGWVFAGRRGIRAEDLREKSARYMGESGRRKKVFRSRYRDIVKRLEGIQFRVIIGMELQSYVDYTAPVRAMDYDVLEYCAQIKNLQSQNRKNRRLNAKEYLCGLRKADRLLPAVTLFLYFGKEPWDAAEDLYGMMDMEKVPDELKACVANYPVRVLDVYHTADERLQEFPDEISSMFLFLKYQENKEKLLELAETEPGFRNMSRDLYETLSVCTNEQELQKIQARHMNAEGEVNMCRAIRELVADGRAEGRIEGKAEGRAEGRIEGKAEGISEVIGMIRRKIQKGKEAAEIADLLEMSEEKVKLVIKLIRTNPGENNVEIAVRFLRS